jgi:hypothetical protein
MLFALNSAAVKISFTSIIILPVLPECSGLVKKKTEHHCRTEEY